ncbi:uncharacterized protein LOC130673901 [Microplitis mediator]|uniref:uncharacterized protein LOC130673901 n=1 Tax=Microplitis mediator TaxID=375433 RepID=UPI002556D988|nr:uncharacterized protein LOC130673901 [Microplitis mediator]
MTLNFSVPRHSPLTFRHRNWSLISSESIADKVNNSSVLFCDNYLTVDDSVSHMNQNLLHIIDSIAPERVIKVTHPPAPWISDDVRDLQRRRDKLYRIYRRSGYADKEYCNVRHLVKKRIIEAKKNYLQDRFKHAKCPKAIWNDFRKLGLLRDSSKMFVSPHLDLDRLNNYFVSVGSSRRDCDNYQDICVNDANDSNSTNQFNFIEITEEDIKRNMKRITTTAVGPDGLSITYYKVLQQILLPSIANLFNISLRTFQFPKQWKKSIVLPLPKVRCPQSCDDYRPISILCPLSKVLERCVHDQLIYYIKVNNLLDPYQTGFQEGMNTQTAVIRLCDDIRFAIDGRKVTVAVFFDFSKAFDCVDHSLLLLTLKNLNLSSGALLWIESYLSNRTQAVKHGDSLSSWQCSQSGVPQGSVLGPLLFSLFVSELGLQIKCKNLFYADDLVVYISCLMSDLNDAVLKLNEDVNLVVEWCSNNFLKLNASKTRSIIFGSPQHVNDPACIAARKIMIGDTVTDYSVSVKY